MRKVPISKKLAVYVLLVVVLISLSGNIYLGLIRKPSSIVSREREYPFLARRILIDNPNDVLINFIPLRNTLGTMVNPWGETFSFYFEYLPTGTSIGINGNNEFIIASLVKVPVAMAYFRKQERLGLDFSNNTVTVKEKDLDSSFGDLWKQGAGTQLTMQEALRFMLVFSDNTAANVVATSIPPEDFDSVFAGLDINLQEQDGKTTISAKGYSSILKALYFSAIINEQHSQEILGMLSQTPFNDQLVAGVPKDVTVSHKIGVYGDLYQDCGIVYVPDRPYVLCMISKTPKDEAQKRMSAVSRTVYDYVIAVNEPNQSSGN